jgi:uncharacterized protein
VNILRRKRWSPYAAGAGIGVLSWFAFATVDRPIGVSTALARTAGMIEQVAAPAHVAANAYFAKFKPAVDWEWMLVLGVAIGAWLSSRLSGDRPAEPVEGLWRRRFGASPGKRYAGAFFGGVVLMLGARIAGGCTSGHGISGSLQLAVSGWLFFASIFASGLLTAWLLYGKEHSRG